MNRVRSAFVSLMLTILLPLSHAFAQSEDIGIYIESYTAKNNFNGTIIIHKDGRVIFHEGFGSANIQFNIPNTTESKFKVASITKAFTAVLILQLYEENKIDLNATINAYLPNYSGEGAGKVTIHQLLSHTSGIENVEKYASAEFEKPWNDIYQKPFTTDEILTKYCSGPLINEPGTNFDYNNGEYIILGKIIESICGKSYEQVLEDRILQPLNMENSGMYFQSKVVENISNTYIFDETSKQFENDRTCYVENWYASGAMYSTAADLLKFSNALFGNKLLNEETLKLMLEPVLANYGCGVWVRMITENGKDYRIMQRYGRIRGANSAWFRFVDQDLTIIVISNSDATNMNDFAHGLSRRLCE